MSLSVQRNQEIERLQKLGYRFKRIELLAKALTHVMAPAIMSVWSLLVTRY